MRIDKVSNMRRKRTTLADTRNIKPSVFIRWNASIKAYEGVIEFTNPTGEKFEVIADQLTWETINHDIMAAFVRDAHA